MMSEEGEDVVGGVSVTIRELGLLSKGVYNIC